MSYNIRLLIDCPDHKGLIAAISNFIALHNGNIVERRPVCERFSTPHFFHEARD